MKALPRLAESLFVEGAQGVAVPVFGVGTPLPAVRRHSLPAPQSQQVGLDFHVLHGSAADPSGRRSLGHWRISGVQPSNRPASQLRIQFIVDAAGCLDLIALQDRQQLTMTLLEQGSERMAVDASGLEPGWLASAWSRLEAGQAAQVQEELATFLQNQPGSLAAWALLAALVDQPLRKADCYRQVLALDPGNLAALAALQAIPDEAATATETEPHPEPLPLPSRREDGALICPRCAAVMEVRASEPQGRHAFCPGCGAAIELPSSFDTPLSEPAAAAGLATPGRGEAQDVEDEDAIIADLVRANLEPRPRPSPAPKGSLFSRLARRFGREPAAEATPSAPPRPAAPGARAPSGQDPLDPALVLQLAGGPLTAEKRVPCPECGATISRDRESCPWCSASLTEPDEP